jgi:sugar O-acyltransferase (sialic acid O-acetyltransferase NeuD family)
MFPVADVGTANVDFLSERRRISENRQAVGLKSGISLGHFIGEACSRSSHGYTIPGHRRISGVFRQASEEAGVIKKGIMPKILLIGSSYHASVVLDAITVSGAYEIAGCLDDMQKRGTIRKGYAILGGIGDASRVVAEYGVDSMAIAVGDNWSRRKIFLTLMNHKLGVTFPVIRHPSAIVASDAEIGQGTAIFAGSHVGPGSRIGEFCIINTASSVDHDCVLRDFSSIAPGVSMGGLVKIGECSAVGVGANISDRISIGNHAVVGTGSAVVRDIPDLVVAYGNPARVKRSRREEEKHIE